MKTIKEILSESVDLEKHDFKLNPDHSLQNVNGLNESIMPLLQAALGGLRSAAITAGSLAAGGIKNSIQHGLSVDPQTGKTRMGQAMDHNREYRFQRMQQQQMRDQMNQQNSMQQ